MERGQQSQNVCLGYLRVKLELPHSSFGPSVQIGQLFGMFKKNAVITCPLSMTYHVGYCRADISHPFFFISSARLYILNASDLNATMQTLGSPKISNPDIFSAASTIYSKVENIA